MARRARAAGDAGRRGRRRLLRRRRGPPVLDGCAVRGRVRRRRRARDGPFGRLRRRRRGQRGARPASDAHPPRSRCRTSRRDRPEVPRPPARRRWPARARDQGSPPAPPPGSAEPRPRSSTASGSGPSMAARMPRLGRARRARSPAGGSSVMAGNDRGPAPGCTSPHRAGSGSRSAHDPRRVAAGQCWRSRARARRRAPSGTVPTPERGFPGGRRPRAWPVRRPPRGAPRW